MKKGRECLQNLSKYTEQKRNTAFMIENNGVSGNKAYYSRAIYLGYWKESLSKILKI